MPRTQTEQRKAKKVTDLAYALAAGSEMKKSECMKMLNGLVSIATVQVKSTGRFAWPGMFCIKINKKPATEAHTGQFFGHTFTVKAKPAQTAVKVIPFKTLKKNIS